MSDNNQSARLRRSRAIWFGAAASAVILVIALFALARLIDPAPPQTIQMATGAVGGAYAASGDAIAAQLSRDGITVDVVNTSGSVENLDLLATGAVDAAILQGGVGGEETENLESLGGLFFEPLWVFARSDLDVADMRDLAGRRVAMGPPGSGTRALALMLLQENGVDEEDVDSDPSGGDAAAEALFANEVDIAIFVTAPDRAYIRALLGDARARVVSFKRADAYSRRHRYLSAVVLPRGVVDLERDVPGEDVTLIAPAAALVVRGDIHPAIQDLLLQAVFDIYRNGDVIAPPGAFPSRDLVAFPLSDRSARYFERGGPSFLQRYLPFWAANLVDRLWILAIPLLTLMYPLVKAAPPVYRWQVRRRIIRWYRDLRALEARGRNAGSESEKATVRDELARILDEVGALSVPLSYNDDVYRLRSHIRLVDQLVMEADVAAGGV